MEEKTPHMKKQIWLGLSIIVVLVAAAATYYLLTTLAPQPNSHKTITKEETAASLKKAGVTAEANGDSKIALNKYEAAYELYKKEGDKDAALDMSYKIKFLKDTIAADEAATKQAIKNGDTPSEE